MTMVLPTAAARASTRTDSIRSASLKLTSITTLSAPSIRVAFAERSFTASECTLGENSRFDLISQRKQPKNGRVQDTFAAHIRVVNIDGDAGDHGYTPIPDEARPASHDPLF